MLVLWASHVTALDSWAPAAIIWTTATVKSSTVDLPRTESDRGKSKLTFCFFRLPSACASYAYKYTSCRRVVVATLDLSAVNFDQFDRDHWLSFELNVVVLRLTEPAFGARAEPTSPRPSAPPCKRRWPNTPPR